MKFYVLFDLKKQQEEQILSIINQNLNAPFDKQIINGGFFQTSPNEPDFSSLQLEVQCLTMTIYQNKPFILKKFVIDVKSEILNPEPNNKIVLYEP